MQAELGALLDGELPQELAGEVGRHVAKCDACAAELEQVRALRERVRRIERPAPRAPDSLLARFERARRLARREPED